MQIALPPNMDMMLTWKARYVFILVDNLTGEDWSGIPPQDVRCQLMVSVHQVNSIQDIMFKHAKSVFEGLLEDYMSKYPDAAFEGRERLSAKAIPIYMFPVR